MASPPPSKLGYDVIYEILLRLPPDEPECLFRAALVCKAWLRTVSDPDFLRLYRDFHGAPPLLGLIYRGLVADRRWAAWAPRFVHTPTTGAPTFPIPWSDSHSTLPLDCRHGRVLLRLTDDRSTHLLFLTDDRSIHLLVSDPVADVSHRVPRPYSGAEWEVYNAAAGFCAAAGCKHLVCHGGPFYVAFVVSDRITGTLLRMVYSSELGTWSAPATLESLDYDCDAYGRGALLGDGIYFALSRGTEIAKYDWGNSCLSVVKSPPLAGYKRPVAIMVMEDGSLGLAAMEDSGASLHLWSRRVSSESEAAAEWVQCRVIDLVAVMTDAHGDSWSICALLRRGCGCHHCQHMCWISHPRAQVRASEKG